MTIIILPRATNSIITSMQFRSPPEDSDRAVGVISNLLLELYH